MNAPRLSKIDAMGVLCLALLGGAAWWLGVQPVHQARAAAMAARQSAADADAEATGQEKGVAQLRLDLAEAQVRVASSRVRLLSVDELNQRVGMLTRAASGAGLTIEQITPGQAEGKGRVVHVPIKLMAKATYSATSEFLAHLHEAFPDVSVTALKLESGPENAPGRTAPGALELRIVWHASAGSAGGADKAKPRGTASAQTP